MARQPPHVGLSVRRIDRAEPRPGSPATCLGRRTGRVHEPPTAGQPRSPPRPGHEHQPPSSSPPSRSSPRCISIYIVSQFLRNSIGVIAPNLAEELGLSPAELGLLSSAYFFAFAAVQIPVGMALDRFGPRALPHGRRGHHGDRRHRVRDGRQSPAVLILGRALLGLGTRGFAGGVARGLCQAISRRIALPR